MTEERATKETQNQGGLSPCGRTFLTQAEKLRKRICGARIMYIFRDINNGGLQRGLEAVVHEISFDAHGFPEFTVHEAKEIGVNRWCNPEMILRIHTRIPEEINLELVPSFSLSAGSTWISVTF